jgi:hypothetical protein
VDELTRRVEDAIRECRERTECFRQLRDRLHETLERSRAIRASTPRQGAWERYAMARKLIWIEKGSFAAWGCNACSWLLPNQSPLVAGRPPLEVKNDFNRHGCDKFPQTIMGRVRKGLEPGP